MSIRTSCYVRLGKTSGGLFLVGVLALLVALPPGVSSAIWEKESYSWNNPPPGTTDFHATFYWSRTWAKAEGVDKDGNTFSGQLTFGGEQEWSCATGISGLHLVCDTGVFSENFLSAYWTPSKTPVGKPSVVTTTAYTDNGTGSYTAACTLANLGSSAVQVSNTAAYVNNSADQFASYEMAGLFSHSGTAVPVAASFGIAAGDSVTLQLGTVTGAGYETFQAYVADASDPSIHVDLGIATMVPEPAVSVAVLLVAYQTSSRARRRVIAT